MVGRFRGLAVDGLPEPHRGQLWRLDRLLRHRRQAVRSFAARRLLHRVCLRSRYVSRGGLRRMALQPGPGGPNLVHADLRRGSRLPRPVLVRFSKPHHVHGRSRAGVGSGASGKRADRPHHRPRRRSCKREDLCRAAPSRREPGAGNRRWAVAPPAGKPTPLIGRSMVRRCHRGCCGIWRGDCFERS